MDNQLLLMRGIVVEFPEHNYVLSVTKKPDSVYEYVCLTPNYKVIASRLFCWFRNMRSSCTSENCLEYVPLMISVFKLYNDDLFSSLREYILIDGILDISNRMQLQDNDLVCEVLNLLYECWSSFGPLHFKAILGRRRKSWSRSQPDLLIFCLEHARRKKLEYSGVRMIDVSLYSSMKISPIRLAIDTWNWKRLLTYLQYGANFERLIQDPSRSEYGLSLTITDTFRMLIRHLWLRLVHPALHRCFSSSDTVVAYCLSLEADVKDLCQTFNVLLRAVRRIQRGSLEYVIKDCNGNNRVVDVESRVVMKHRTVIRMIPKLFKRYESPEELQHICRWVIRERLSENWQLPSGISELPLPGQLQRYLNLLVD